MMLRVVALSLDSNEVFDSNGVLFFRPQIPEPEVVVTSFPKSSKSRPYTLLMYRVDEGQAAV